MKKSWISPEQETQASVKSTYLANKPGICFQSPLPWTFQKRGETPGGRPEGER